MPDDDELLRAIVVLPVLGDGTAAYYPNADVAFKMDFIQEGNKSSVVNAPWRMNFGVGWWF